MRHSHLIALRLAIVTSVLTIAGCRTDPMMPEGVDEAHRELNRGYGLLHELVDKQSNVDKILIVKSATKETKDLITEIARASADAVIQLKQFAESDDAVSLGPDGLPVMERATRDAIESTTSKQLLFGGDFELRLLLAQADGTRYGAHMARMLADADSNEQRRTWLRSFAESYGKLHDRVIARLKDREASP